MKNNHKISVNNTRGARKRKKNGKKKKVQGLTDAKPEKSQKKLGRSGGIMQGWAGGVQQKTYKKTSWGNPTINKKMHSKPAHQGQEGQHT